MKKNEPKALLVTRILMVLIGNLFIGVGVAAFKFACLGNDPFDGMNMALSDLTGIYYPLLQIIVNVCFFVIQIIWGRKLIGFGTVINALLLGYVVDFSYKIMTSIWALPGNLVIKILIMLLGLILTGFGLSLYQTSDMGVAPYDALALIMDKKIKKLPYFWCRIICDASCALVCFLAGGVMGPGIIVSAFGFGPVISFFNRFVSVPLIKKHQTA